MAKPILRTDRLNRAKPLGKNASLVYSSEENQQVRNIRCMRCHRMVAPVNRVYTCGCGAVYKA